MNAKSREYINCKLRLCYSILKKNILKTFFMESHNSKPLSKHDKGACTTTSYKSWFWFSKHTLFLIQNLQCISNCKYYYFVIPNKPIQTPAINYLTPTSEAKYNVINTTYLLKQILP